MGRKDGKGRPSKSTGLHRLEYVRETKDLDGSQQGDLVAVGVPSRALALPGEECYCPHAHGPPLRQRYAAAQARNASLEAASGVVQSRGSKSEWECVQEIKQNGHTYMHTMCVLCCCCCCCRGRHSILTTQATPRITRRGEQAGGVTACRIRKEQAQASARRGRPKQRDQYRAVLLRLLVLLLYR